MQKTALKLWLALVLGFALSGNGQQNAPKGGGTILGTWELVSSRYGDAKESTPPEAGVRHIKLITPTHFTWVHYDNGTKKVTGMAGGTYSLTGNDYVETIEFAAPGMEPYLGKKQTFNIKIDGDKLHQSGKLSDGFKIEEVWRRATK